MLVTAKDCNSLALELQLYQLYVAIAEVASSGV